MIYAVPFINTCPCPKQAVIFFTPTANRVSIRSSRDQSETLGIFESYRFKDEDRKLDPSDRPHSHLLWYQRQQSFRAGI